MAGLKLSTAFLRLFVAVNVVTLFGQPVLAQESQEGLESGNDVTRPTRRFDIRAEYESSPEERVRKVTLRYDHPLTLSEEWRLNLRIDVPFASATPRGEHAEHHEKASGAGDVLLHAVFAHHVHENEGLGFGAELIIPTAGKDPLGKGKWRIRPMAGYRWSLPKLGEESFFQLVARYDVSVAGDSNRPDVSELQIAPNLEVELSPSTFVSFFPNADIHYDFIHKEFFVPIAVEVGKNVGNFVLSVEVGKAIIRGDHPAYDWKTEARVGLRF